MKKPTIAVTGQKKGNYKRLTGPYDWDLGIIIFEKEEKRRKKEYTETARFKRLAKEYLKNDKMFDKEET